MTTPLQIDFPLQGPWGDGFGSTDIRARLFDVNEPLTAVNHGPLER